MRRLTSQGSRWSTAFRRLALPASNRLKAVLQRGPRPTWGAALVIGLVVALGCTDDKPKGELPALHPAKGKVVRNGQPVNGGLVRFFAQPEDPDLVVNSEVNSDGTFELQSLHAQSQKKAKGAPAGTYQVTYYPPAGDQTQGPSPEPISPSQPQTIQAGSNDLTVEVGKK